MQRTTLLLLALVGAAPALAQQSTSFKLAEHVFNAGGRPDAGSVAQSTSFRVSLDAIGEGVSLTGLASASFGMDAGFVAPYPPPREVTGLRFLTHEKFVWDPEKSTGSYALYRSLVSSLPGLAYGVCKATDLLGEATADIEEPGLNQAFFYLVTARNLLDEEGTKGFDSAGAERANPAPCP